MMDRITHLITLAETLSRSHGGYEENAQIWLAINKPDYVFPEEVMNRRPKDYQEAHSRFTPDGFGMRGGKLPDYTRDVETALSICPEGWSTGFATRDGATKVIFRGRRSSIIVNGTGSIAAVVCAASLRALAYELRALDKPGKSEVLFRNGVWSLEDHRESVQWGFKSWTELLLDGKHVAHFPDRAEAEYVLATLTKD